MISLLQFDKVIPSPVQINYLYFLLKKRVYLISHSKLPNKKEHKNFVLENPYLEWYLIFKNKKLIGSVYVQSDNSIGLDIIEITKQNVVEIISFIKLNHNPLPPIKSVRRKEFFMNVSLTNKKLIKILQDLGKDEIQLSFLI